MLVSYPFWAKLAILLLTWAGVLSLSGLSSRDTYSVQCAFSEAKPIWTTADPPSSSHEVGLFRKQFRASRPQVAHIRIFADTRYELWLNEEWIGRGPARFSRRYREYDMYTVRVSTGINQLAVLVQWAPNTRRSESQVPYLMAVLELGGGCVTTDETWKATVSEAWRRDAAQVYLWRLIGPTELLDLSALPKDWMSVDYDDSSWQAAVVKQRVDEGAQYAPRSIPQQTETLLLPHFMEGGRLSPDHHLIVISPRHPEIAFSLTTTSRVTVETLVFSRDWPTPTLPTVTLDGRPVEWTHVGESRPDVIRATYVLGSGEHVLSAADLPDGMALALSRHNLTLEHSPHDKPFWSTHSGWRNLLAYPHPDSAAVSVEVTSLGLTLTFRQTPAYAVLDLGRVVHGRVYARVDGPPDAVVDIGWDERLWFGRRPLPYPGSLHYFAINQIDSWLLDGSARDMRTIDARAGRYLWISVWNSTQPVTIGALHVREERYPVEQRGSFHSNDALLNRIWQVGVDTLYPNMTDAYTDTPWRERGQWWGDAFVGFQINRVAFGDALLFRRALRFMGEGIDAEGKPSAFVPGGASVMLLDFGLLWVHALKEYWQLTEDKELVRAYYPKLHRLMQYAASFVHPQSGLLDMPRKHWSQIAFLDWSVSDSRYGQSTALNAIYYQSLRDAAVLASTVGDDQGAYEFEQRAKRVLSGLLSRSYMPLRRAYADTLLEGEPLPPSLQAQAWAISHGAVPNDLRAKVLRSLNALVSLHPSARMTVPSTSSVQPYGMYWLLRALGESRAYAEALEVIRSYYGEMLRRGATTWWERFFADRYYTASYSHAWGGSPTWFLSTYILGAEQLSPRSWRLTPAWVVSMSVSGTLPLLGSGEELHVRWERLDCAFGELSLRAPHGSVGELKIMQVNALRLLALNGRTVWQDGEPLVSGVVQDEEGLTVRHISGGTHHVVLHWNCESATHGNRDQYI